MDGRGNGSGSIVTAMWMNYILFTVTNSMPVYLWCYMPALSNQVKRKSSSEPTTSKCSRIAEKNEAKARAAKEIFETLKVKHAGKYTAEQLHSWAQLVEMEKHDSLEEPPNYCFYKKKSRDLPRIMSNTEGLSRVRMRT